MRAPNLALASALILAAGILAAGPTPALAQLSGGVGSSNAANQSFQQENSMRGLQQQQNFNNNQSQLNSSVSRMNSAPASQPGAAARPIARPERER